MSSGHISASCKIHSNRERSCEQVCLKRVSLSQQSKRKRGEEYSIVSNLVSQVERYTRLAPSFDAKFSFNFTCVRCEFVARGGAFLLTMQSFSRVHVTPEPDCDRDFLSLLDAVGGMS